MTSARGTGWSGPVVVTALLGLTGVMGLAACGDDGAVAEPTAAAAPVTEQEQEQAGAEETTAGAPDLCEDLAAVRGSVETMRGATIGDGAVPVVAEELRSLETALPELRAAAAEQYQAQVEQVEVSTAAVRSSVDAAQADTSAPTLLAVTTAVRALGATVDGLVEDVGDTC